MWRGTVAARQREQPAHWGNKTQKQAEQAGIKEAIVVETDGSRMVVVKRTDLDLENDPKARELAYLDNRTQELNLAWDASQVAADVGAGLDLSLMFYDDELDRIMGQVLNIDNDKFKVKDHAVWIPLLGWVNMTENLRFEGKLMSARITYSAGYGWVSITVDIPHPPSAQSRGGRD